MATDKPKQVTIYGWLSFPQFTAQEAYDRSQSGQYKAADVASAAPNFLLLVGDTQWEKFLKHVINEFFPYCESQHAKGEKKDALDPNEVKQLIAGLKDLPNQMLNTPAKPVHEKSAELRPEAVATIKCIGPKGGNIELKAIARSESDLRVPDPDILVWPTVVDLSATNYQMYPGAVVAATLNLYAYHVGKFPGFSAGAGTAVFRADADRFGGSVAVDEDEIFLD